MNAQNQHTARYAALTTLRALTTNEHRPSWKNSSKLYDHTISTFLSPELEHTSRQFKKNLDYKIDSKSYSKNKSSLFHNVMTPEKAHQAIEENICTLFEGKSSYSVLEHFDQIKELAKYLDPIKDKEKIDAINFVAQNKEKTSYSEIITFWWWQAWENGHIRHFPIPEKIKKTPCTQVIPRLAQLAQNL